MLNFKDFEVNYEEMFTALLLVAGYVFGCVLGIVGGLAVFG